MRTYMLSVAPPTNLVGSLNELKPTVVGRADGGIIPRILVGSRNELKPTIVGRANGGIIPPTWWVYPPYFLQCTVKLHVASYILHGVQVDPANRLGSLTLGCLECCIEYSDFFSIEIMMMKVLFG